jgi:hypothetical protein
MCEEFQRAPARKEDSGKFQEEYDDDRIVTISRPYLQGSFMD